MPEWGKARDLQFFKQAALTTASGSSPHSKVEWARMSQIAHMKYQNDRVNVVIMLVYFVAARIVKAGERH